MLGRGDAEGGVQRLTGPVAKRRTAGLGGIAVALGTYLQLPLARQEAGMDHGLAGLGIRMGLVKGHVLAARAVAPLARHPQKEVLTPVFVWRPGHMLEPGVVTFHAAG